MRLPDASHRMRSSTPRVESVLFRRKSGQGHSDAAGSPLSCLHHLGLPFRRSRPRPVPGSLRPPDGYPTAPCISSDPPARSLAESLMPPSLVTSLSLKVYSLPLIPVNTVRRRVSATRGLNAIDIPAIPRSPPVAPPAAPGTPPAERCGHPRRRSVCLQKRGERKDDEQTRSDK